MGFLEKQTRSPERYEIDRRTFDCTNRMSWRVWCVGALIVALPIALMIAGFTIAFYAVSP